jgi:hypothetical protein
MNTNQLAAKWVFVTPSMRLQDLIRTAEIYKMTVQEFLAYEQWDSIEHYINFKQGLGYQPKA